MTHFASIDQIMEQQKNYFASGATLSLVSRIHLLKEFKKSMQYYAKEIEQALYKDLKKPTFESHSAEVFLVIQEINYALRCIKDWNKSIHVSNPWYLWPSTSTIQPEPRGQVLIIAPWNYPIQLCLIPLVGAIAAGNCAIIKPSEFAPHAANILDEIISKTFDPSHVKLLQGDQMIAQQLLKSRFDYIFFTGSVAVGKIIMKAAAEYLTPVTLELGGKNPCIVHSDADLHLAAKRIAWGKFINVGQNCVAPDYIFIHYQKKTEFLNELQSAVTKFYGTNPAQSKDYGRIINERHFDRLVALLNQENIIFGGQIDRSDLYISPTIIDNPSWRSPVMQEEIFGPILPIITYKKLEQVIEIINNKSKPLAAYIFSSDHCVHKKIIRHVASGGVCINDVVMHVASPYLPFGGIGMSGFGQYHGKKSFETFSHYKPILQSQRTSFSFRYPPYGRLHIWIQKIIVRIQKIIDFLL
jgi:aldehyde dehydrogenase (NAD+)